MATIQARQPKHSRVAEQIRKRIRDGKYSPGATLPGRRMLSAEYDAAPLTIQNAIDELVAEGLLRTENGRGTFVAGGVDGGATPVVSPGLVGILARAWCDNWDEPGSENAAVVKSAERAIAAHAGTSVCQNIHRRDGSRIRLAEGLHALLDQGVTGVVVVHEEDREQIDECLSDPALAKLPIVFAVGQDLALPVSTAYYDNFHWGELAAEHLIGKGCRRILAFSPYGISWAIDRASGARDGVKAAGLPDYAFTSIIGDGLVGDGIRAPFHSDPQYYQDSFDFAEQMLAGDFPYDAVLAANDSIAIGLRDALRRKGLEPGRDYALMGFDDKNSARLAGLTSIQLPNERLGRRAAHLLCRLIAGEPGPINIKVPGHVIARQSTDLPAIAGVGIGRGPSPESPRIS
ncbi:MAG TPA: GntR family transcriptional regulator [Capsulimonadaceae bacterium]|jgi:DNA-binding LacI/PurR family transcriptional regulator